MEEFRLPTLEHWPEALFRETPAQGEPNRRPQLRRGSLRAVTRHLYFFAREFAGCFCSECRDSYAGAGRCARRKERICRTASGIRSLGSFHGNILTSALG